MAYVTIYLRPTEADNGVIRKCVADSGLSLNEFCISAILKACGSPDRPKKPPPLTPTEQEKQEKKARDLEYNRLIRKHMGIRLKGEK